MLSTATDTYSTWEGQTRAGSTHNTEGGSEASETGILGCQKISTCNTEKCHSRQQYANPHFLNSKTQLKTTTAGCQINSLYTSVRVNQNHVTTERSDWRRWSCAVTWVCEESRKRMKKKTKETPRLMLRKWNAAGITTNGSCTSAHAQSVTNQIQQGVSAISNRTVPFARSVAQTNNLCRLCLALSGNLVVCAIDLAIEERRWRTGRIC